MMAACGRTIASPSLLARRGGATAPSLTRRALATTTTSSRRLGGFDAPRGAGSAGTPRGVVLAAASPRDASSSSFPARAAPSSSFTVRRAGLIPASTCVPSGASSSCAPRRLAVLAAGAAGGADASAKKGNKKDRKKKEDSVYSKTVLLPQTSFEMRANSVTKEPAIQSWWAENGVYEQIASREGANGETFTLHDGPPYANGDLHIGHALNKILKDFVCRYEALKGKRVRFVPGWDCHGLPIELKVLQSMDKEKRAELTPIKLRKKARNFALKTVDAQREQFKRYGVWADWEDPYLTLLPEYEGAQMEVFGQMFLNGHVYRGKKPVHWSPSSMTALAEAELEYPEGHVSTSVYVAFPINADDEAANFPAEHREKLKNASLAVWTTTPWTMPANAAVAVNDKLSYSLCEVTGVAATKEDAPSSDAAAMVGKTLIVATDLVSDVASRWGLTLAAVADVAGAQLEGLTYAHPFYPADGDRAFNPVVIGGEYITTESGTGLVHTAPGHGQEDYITGLKHGLPLISPVDDAGKFTEDAGDDLNGLAVLDAGNAACVEKLRDVGALIMTEAYGHKYPYDWRTKKPTIFRATEQWFASVEGFRDEALKALDGIEFIPASGAKRMRPMVSGRNDWCISRQRSWGVPIPCFYDVETREPLMDERTIKHVTEIVREKGTDAWWEMDLVDLLPEEYKDRADSLVRGTDTMDVWFDSGSSWAGVCKARGLNYPADMYLEGSDQHRGWFQSSLLTGVAAAGQAPYKTILTHGFVLDEKGYKMSKSLGNVIDPRLVIEGGKNQKQDPAFGADTLRLWVASTDYTSDVLIGMNVLKQTSDAYRKLRGTLRFLMGNIGDFAPEKDGVKYEDLPAFERYALRRTAAMVNEMERHYQNFAYSGATATLQSFTTFLSNVYLDVSKDRLYIESPNSPERRACQTVVAHVVESLLACVAPLTPHMAEEAYRELPYDTPEKSVFLAGWKTPPAEWHDGSHNGGMSDADYAFWNSILAVRGEVNRALEIARGEKIIGASLEASAAVYASDASFAERLAAATDDLKRVTLVSEMTVVTDEAEISNACGGDGVGAVTELDVTALESDRSTAGAAEVIRGGAEGSGRVVVGVRRATGTKCARCWEYTTDAGSDERHPELCARCTPIVIAIDPELRAPVKAAEGVAA